MRIVNLASGSKANSTLVSYGDTKILIDVGLTEKKLETELNILGESLKNIVGVLVTHEHIDHIRSLSVLAKKYDIDFYLHQKLADTLIAKGEVFKDGKLHTFENGSFNVGDFDVSHDAVAPVGYVVRVFGSKTEVGFATDLGVVTESVKRHLSNVKTIFIESNYDEKMLAGGKYPKIVKERIASNVGHLSNIQSLELAKFLYGQGTKCFVLSHISENNNAPEIAYSNYIDYFESQGVKQDKDVFIRVSFQNKHGNNFNIKEDFDGK